MKYTRYNFQPTEFHTYSYKSDHRYNLQNDLLKQYNFPLYYYQTEDRKHGDFISSFYEDRTWYWTGFWDEALNRLSDEIRERVKPRLNHGVIGFSNISESDMLALLQAKYPENNIVGFRLVRYTNVSNGYPTDYLECFGKSNDTPEMEFGKNIAYNDCPNISNEWDFYEKW